MSNTIKVEKDEKEESVDNAKAAECKDEKVVIKKEIKQEKEETQEIIGEDNDNDENKCDPLDENVSYEDVDEYRDENADDFIEDEAIDDALNDIVKDLENENEIENNHNNDNGNDDGENNNNKDKTKDNEGYNNYNDDDDNEELKSQHDDAESYDGFYHDDEQDSEFMKMFQSKIELSDGTKEYLFSSGVRYSRLLPSGEVHYSKSYFPINCHLCKCSGLRGKITLRKHIESSEHKKLLNGKPPNAEEYRKPLSQPYGIKHLVNPIKIYPGEVIKRLTPEYHNRLLPIKELEFRPRPSKKLLEELKDDPVHDYNKNSPVLGLCYAFKMKVNSRMTLYYCALCRTDLYGEAYQHFVGAGHQASYILLHFKNLHSQISEALEERISNGLIRRKAVRSIFRVLYRKIELLRGLRRVTIMNAEDFHKAQRKLVNVCRNSLFQYHYDENTIEFDKKEIKELIDKAVKNEHIIDPDPRSMKEKRKPNTTRVSSSSSSTSRRRLPPSSERREKEPIRRVSRKERSGFSSDNVAPLSVTVSLRRSKSPPRSNETDTPTNWDRYRRMLGATLDDLDKKYEKYEADPENHPKYEHEWKIFWRRRVKELERDNIDPEIYDFKPEWEAVWATLLKKFYQSDVARRKLDIKKSLNLPLNKGSPSPIRRRKVRVLSPIKSSIPSLLTIQTAKPIDDEYDKRNQSNRDRYRLASPVKVEDSYNKRTRLRSPSPIMPSTRYEQEVVDQQQLERKERHRHRHHRHRSSSNHHSTSEYHNSPERVEHRDYESEKMYNEERRRTRSRSRGHGRHHSHGRSPRRSSPNIAEKHKKNPSSTSSEPLTVISILRLLTALEDQLGSLGPKAIDFLGKAILYEKEHKGNSNQLLNNQEYYMFFMTSMEKLRGQIMANIVQSHRIHAVNNAISDLETVINQFDEYKRKNQVIFGEGGNRSHTSNISANLNTSGSSGEKIMPLGGNIFENDVTSYNSSRKQPSSLQHQPESQPQPKPRYQSYEDIDYHHRAGNSGDVDENRVNTISYNNLYSGGGGGASVSSHQERSRGGGGMAERNNHQSQRYPPNSSSSVDVNPYNKDPRINAYSNKPTASSGGGGGGVNMYTSNLYNSVGTNPRKHNESNSGGVVNDERFNDLRNILSRSMTNKSGVGGGSIASSSGNMNDYNMSGGSSGNDIWLRSGSNPIMPPHQVNSMNFSSFPSNVAPSAPYYNNQFKGGNNIRTNRDDNHGYGNSFSGYSSRPNY